MSTAPLLTLLSDFGLQDVYVGVMKGVIAQINPALKVIDLTHQVPAQNFAIAGFHLMNAYQHFPQGTVHVAVVDPGVGSGRRAIAIQIPAGFLVGPDNGLFSSILAQSPPIAAVELSNPDYWYSPQPSLTFHGRDIFAPVGAHLASGVELKALGPTLAPEELVQRSLPGWQKTHAGITGYIQAIDTFGNLITNIPGDQLAGQQWFVKRENVKIKAGQTYSDSSPGQLVGLIGSHGWLEIAVNGASAQALFDCREGEAIQIMFMDHPAIEIELGE